MSTKEALLSEAASFCATNGLALSTFGRIVMNDGKFFSRLADGGDCSTSALDKFTSVFSDPSAWEEARAAASARERASRQERMAS